MRDRSKLEDGPLESLRIGRRQFGLLTAAGLGAAVCRPVFAPEAAAETPAVALPTAYGAAQPVALAAVTRGAGDEAVAQAVQRAALAVSDFSWLSRGDTVMLKPVCNSGNVYPATTDPVALRAMIRLLLERGAGRVLVADMSGVQAVRFSPDSLRGSTRELMQSSGMLAAAQDAGAEVVAFEEAGWDAFAEETPLIADHWSGPVMMPSVLSQVDHVVLMPRCARHLLAGSTLGLKAAVGWWRHDSRLVYHREGARLPEMTAEANSVPSLVAKQRLVVTCATRLLTTFGPDEGHVLEPETGLVIASPSVVANDMVSLAWLIEGRRVTPEDAMNGGFDDPHQMGLARAMANRMVTLWLGGFGQMLKAKAPPKSEIASIWEDRVLRRAFDVFDGVPRIELIDADAEVPASLRAGLAREIALPGA